MKIRLAVVLALTASIGGRVVGAAAAPAQNAPDGDGVRRLLQRLERIVTAGDTPAYAAELSETADQVTAIDFAGTELAAACDLVYVAHDATFSYPVVRIISPPDFQYHPWLVGMRNAMELVLTGDPVTGDEGARVLDGAEPEVAPQHLCRRQVDPRPGAVHLVVPQHVVEPVEQCRNPPDATL